MRFTKVSARAAALGATMILGGCASGGSSQGDEMAAAGPTVGETTGNIAVQAAASESIKKGGAGGSIGYGLQSQGHNLSRALFGRKKAQPKPEATAAASN